MASLFCVRKFDGDDEYSWAVFRRAGIPAGHTGIIFSGVARPLVNGCSRSQADRYCEDYEKSARQPIRRRVNR